VNKKSADWGFVFVVICLVFWFCQDLLIGRVPFYRDLTNYFYPLRYSLYECYRTGESCLWDRHFAQGFPNLAAFQSGAFYPPHFVFFFLSFFASVRALFVFHFLVAALGTYALLRRWDCSRDLCLVGSILFALGGTIVSLTNLLNHFQTAVWLPWLILLWERVLVEPKWSRFVAYTFVAALQLLAGSPEIFAMSMALALLDGFRVRDAEPQVSCSRILVVGVAGNLWMLCILAVQILPTIELIAESRRGDPLLSVEAFMWSLKPGGVLNVFFPDRGIETDIGAGIQPYFVQKIPLLLSNYMGLVCLFGVALWIYYATRRERMFLTGLALASLAMALGEHAAVYPFLFRHLPFVSAVRFPEKYFFLTYALLWFAAMRGLKGLWLDDRKGGIQAPAWILGAVCLTWLGLYAFLSVHPKAVADFIAANSSIIPLSEAHTDATVSVLANLQRQLILSVGFVALLILRRASKIRPALFSLLFVAATYVDLAWVHRDILFPASPEKFYATKTVIPPENVRLSRFFFYPSPHDLHPAFFTVMGRPTFDQAVALSFQNYLPNVGIFYGIDYFQEIDALGRRAYNEFLKVANELPFEAQVRLLRNFNVGYLVSFRELPEKGIRLIGHFPKYFSWLYRIEGTVPRLYLVNKVSVERDAAKTLRRLSEPDFEPLKEVILDREVAVRPAAALDARATIERYENATVSVRVEADGDAILVLADSYYPGWKAFVDGRETEIFRANHFYRGVVLPKGEHRVEFHYQPQSFALGVVISAFALLFVAAVSLWELLRERKFAVLRSYASAQVLQD